MDYEEQLSAAKFRAERDQARQELDRGAQDAENRRVELCAMLDVDPGTGWSDAMECMRRRLMPEGMEWLKYDTGEPVPLGGEVKVTVHDEDGDFDRTFAIRSIKYKEYGVLLEGTGNEMVILSHGERVKRPQDSAADDGCCDLGTYRCQEAAFTCDSCGHTVFVDKCMVEEIRYLRAKGIRTLNCCCGHDGKAEPFIIVNEGDECRMLNMGYERHVSEYGATYFTPKSSCPPKVIAADGKPLREGETVWSVDSGTRYTVEKVTDELIPIKCCSEMGSAVSLHPSQLTHAKPKMDSWEQLKADIYKEIEMQPTLRTTKRGIESFVCDIVRRCKALAEKENNNE